jgi:UDP-4-amino-4,6-dideoxy-N-acetyl-beta-L-altrosamine transaminase
LFLKDFKKMINSTGISQKTLSYGKQSIDEDDINAVVEVLRSDWLTQGPNVAAFENALSQKLNAGFTSAVTNGTAGLHLIALALGWQKGDIIITTPITFLASANCIAYVGATPDFVDIDPRSYTIDVAKLEEKLRAFKSEGRKVKAVVAVDYAGHPCDWDTLAKLSLEYGFQLVNDNCHALGATYNGDIGYAAQYADAVNMSFHPVKHITTGEGGAVATNNKEIDAKIKLLRSHGMTKDEQLLEKNDGPWYYEMIELGYNYRITDFQCALGLSQLKKLDDFIAKRREIAAMYDSFFKNDERFIIPENVGNVGHAYHLYPLQINFEKIGRTKKEVFLKLREKNILCQIHYVPVHTQPFYKKNYGFKEGDFPVAEEFYAREISIPMYPALEMEEIEYIVQSIKGALEL